MEEDPAPTAGRSRRTPAWETSMTVTLSSRSVALLVYLCESKSVLCSCIIEIFWACNVCAFAMVSNYFWVVFLLCKECSVTADGEKGKITLISEVLLNEPDYQRLKNFLVYAGEFFFSYSTLNPNSGVSVFDGPYRRFFSSFSL